jgi:hypothetical protein
MTIEVPTPSADLISQVEIATIETNQAEIAAVMAIREKFAAYAKHNGNIRLAHYESSTCDRSVYYYKDSGKRAKALLACNDFTTGREDQNHGSLGGKRLYLLATGEWLEIKRIGSWSAWQGSPNQWGCGEDASPDRDYEATSTGGGYAKIVNDAQVAANWDLEELLKDLGQAMTEMCSKLPERHGRLKARAELAQRAIEALKAGR